MNTTLERIQEVNVVINHCKTIIKTTNDMDRRNRMWRILNRFLKQKQLLLSYLN